MTSVDSLLCVRFLFKDFLEIILYLDWKRCNLNDESLVKGLYSVYQNLNQIYCRFAEVEPFVRFQIDL